MENTLSSRRHRKILLSYVENTLYCSDVYNLAQKSDNSVQIVKIQKITGHTWQRKASYPLQSVERQVG